MQPLSLQDARTVAAQMLGCERVEILLTCDTASGLLTSFYDWLTALPKPDFHGWEQGGYPCLSHRRVWVRAGDKAEILEE